MNLEWIDPPRDYRDDCADIAQQLRQHPGVWARILEDSADVDGYEHELERHGIETRTRNARDVTDRNYNVWTRGDLYARAPKESR